MAKEKKKYEDDDGHSIADMSGIERPSLFLPRMPKKKKAEMNDGAPDDRPWEDNSFSRKERRAYVLGALGAALIIGLVFAIGIGAIIFIMTLIWH